MDRPAGRPKNIDRVANKIKKVYFCKTAVCSSFIFLELSFIAHVIGLYIFIPVKHYIHAYMAYMPYSIIKNSFLIRILGMLTLVVKYPV